MENYWDQYKLKKVLDIESGETIPVGDIYSKDRAERFQLRHKLTTAIYEQKKKIVCPECGGYLFLRGGLHNKDKLHFVHKKEDTECSLKSSNDHEHKPQNPYRGKCESDEHINTKANLLEVMGNDERFSDFSSEIRIICDVNKRKYRQADIYAKFQNKECVFEVQLNSNFPTVIYPRMDYYKKHNINLIWIFSRFSASADNKFTDYDIIYANKENAFVFNSVEFKESINNKRLLLSVYYPKYFINESIGGISLDHEWKKKMIDFSQVTFLNGQAYYVDVESEKEKYTKYIK